RLLELFVNGTTIPDTADRTARAVVRCDQDVPSDVFGIFLLDIFLQTFEYVDRRIAEDQDFVVTPPTRDSPLDHEAGRIRRSRRIGVRDIPFGRRRSQQSPLKTVGDLAASVCGRIHDHKAVTTSVSVKRTDERLAALYLVD